MALKNIWKDKTDGVDDVLAEDINNIAQSVIELEKKSEEKPKIEVDQNYNPLSENPQSGKSVAEAISSKVDIEYVNNNFANALKVEKSEKNALRICMDDFSPIPHNVEFETTPYNFINQDEFFSTSAGGTYVLTLDENNYDKKYFFDAQIKNNLDLSGISITLYREVLGEQDLFTETYDVVKDGNVTEMPFAIQNEIVDGFEFSNIKIAVMDIISEEIHSTIKLSDIFETVSLTTREDVSDVGFKSYGKNLVNFVDSSNFKNRVFSLGNITFPSTVSIEVDLTQNISQIQLRRKKEDGTYDRFNFYSDGILRFNSFTIDGKTIISDKILAFGEYDISYSVNTSNEAIKRIQLEAGTKVTPFETYKTPIDGITLIYYPVTTIVSDTEDVQLTAKYNRDVNKIIKQLCEEIQELKNATLNAGGTL